MEGEYVHEGKVEGVVLGEESQESGDPRIDGLFLALGVFAEGEYENADLVVEDWAMIVRS